MGPKKEDYMRGYGDGFKDGMAHAADTRKASDIISLIVSGWWPTDRADAVTRAVEQLRSEPIYDSGEKANGVSTAFLMRMTILAHEVGILPADDATVQEAIAAFETPDIMKLHDETIEALKQA